MDGLVKFEWTGGLTEEQIRETTEEQLQEWTQRWFARWREKWS